MLQSRPVLRGRRQVQEARWHDADHDKQRSASTKQLPARAQALAWRLHPRGGGEWAHSHVGMRVAGACWSLYRARRLSPHRAVSSGELVVTGCARAREIPDRTNVRRVPTNSDAHCTTREPRGHPARPEQYAYPQQRCTCATSNNCGAAAWAMTQKRLKQAVHCTITTPARSIVARWRDATR